MQHDAGLTIIKFVSAGQLFSGSLHSGQQSFLQSCLPMRLTQIQLLRMQNPFSAPAASFSNHEKASPITAMLKHADGAGALTPAKQPTRNHWRLQLQKALLEPAKADVLSPDSQFSWRLSGAQAHALTQPPADKHEGSDDREQLLADAGFKVPGLGSAKPRSRQAGGQTQMNRGIWAAVL